MRQHIRLLLALFIASVCLSGTAGARPAGPLPPGMGRYVLVLWQRGMLVPGSNPAKVIQEAEEPDVAKLGGQVVFKKDNRRVIVLPLAAAKELRRHPSVMYLQRMWMGEPTDGWEEDFTSASRFLPQANAADEPSWLRTYEYDGSGNIKSAGADHYVYDSSGRLVQATVGEKTESYRYDAFGNLIEKGVTGATPTSMPVDGASNRLIGTSYDAAGNIVFDGSHSYQYDSLNMLIGVYGAAGFDRRMIYDVNDEQIGTLLNGDSVSRWSFRDFSGRVLREFKVDDLQEWYWNQDHFYAGSTLLYGESQRWQYASGQAVYGGWRHYHLDQIGSVRVVTDGLGRSIAENDYYPFGASQTKTYQEQIDPNDGHVDGMRFAGHYRDFLGLLNVENTDYLDNMHARHYDPNMGRFLSVDPVIDVKKALVEPQLWNRYAYVTNNPLRYRDPDGRFRDGYFEKPMTAENLAMDENTPAVVRYANYATGGLTAVGAAGFLGAGGLIASAKEGLSSAGTWALANWDKVQRFAEGVVDFFSPGPSSGRLTSFERASNQLANQLRFTETTAARMSDAGRMVPRSILAQAILRGARSADPQGAPGAVQITQNIVKNGKDYVLQVIYREKDNMILHFHYAAAK